MSCDVGEVTGKLGEWAPLSHFTYVTTNSPTLPSLYLHHSSFSNPSVASSTSQFAHSPTFPSLHLRHNSFSYPSVALSTSQFILQPFRCFTYVTTLSPTLLSLLLRHRLFTWRVTHAFLVAFFFFLFSLAVWWICQLSCFRSARH